MKKIKLQENLYDPNEFGEWICPICRLHNSDPNFIRRTVCGNCETYVLLGPTNEGIRNSIPETYILKNGKRPV